MDLVYSVVFAGLAVVLFVVVLRGTRMPNQPGWASEGLTADLSCVAITGLLAFGMAFGVRFVLVMQEQALGLMELALVVTALAACYLTVRRLAPRRRLAEYADEQVRNSGISESYGAAVVGLSAPAGRSGSPSEPTLPNAA